MPIDIDEDFQSFEVFCIPVGIPLSGEEWMNCRTRGEQRHGNQKNPFPNTTSRMDVRNTRMSLFGEKKKKKKLERELLCHFPNGLD
jgi:hypothetical protein